MLLCQAIYFHFHFVIWQANTDVLSYIYSYVIHMLWDELFAPPNYLICFALLSVTGLFVCLYKSKYRTQCAKDRSCDIDYSVPFTEYLVCMLYLRLERHILICNVVYYF